MTDTNVVDQRAVAEASKDEKRERMLCYIRDTLVERAWGLRTAFEANSFVYCASPEGKEQLKRVVALEAAADVFTHIVAEWQRNPEKRPEWVKTIAKQAMSAFVGAFA
jgi:hypothetical protein